MASAVERLQAWYLAQCDGGWEHVHGVTISTIDNPGWELQVNLDGTRWAGREFAAETVDRSEHDWFRCWVRDNYFHAACGPCNLDEAIGRFLAWTDVPDAPPPSGQAVDDIFARQCEWS